MIAIRPARAVRRLVVLLAGAALAATLAGCGSFDAGAAAVVDGRRISVAEVQQAAEQLETYVGQPVPQSQVLYYLIVGPRLVDAAARAGVGVSADDARGALAGKVPDPGPGTIVAVQANEALNRLGSLGEDRARPLLDELVTGLRAADIEVNPRYGSFDSEKIEMGEDGVNWFVESQSSSGS